MRRSQEKWSHQYLVLENLKCICSLCLMWLRRKRALQTLLCYQNSNQRWPVQELSLMKPTKFMPGNRSSNQYLRSWPKISNKRPYLQILLHSRSKPHNHKPTLSHQKLLWTRKSSKRTQRMITFQSPNLRSMLYHLYTRVRLKSTNWKRLDRSSSSSLNPCIAKLIPLTLDHPLQKMKKTKRMALKPVRRRVLGWIQRKWSTS